MHTYESRVRKIQKGNSSCIKYDLRRLKREGSRTMPSTSRYTQHVLAHMKHSIMFDIVHGIKLPTYSVSSHMPKSMETKHPLSSYLQNLPAILASRRTYYDEESRDNRTKRDTSHLLLMGLNLHNGGREWFQI